MPLVSAPALVNALREFRLLEPAQFDELTRDLITRFPEPKALARELLRRGWLTAYQANLLLQGRGRELVLGSYVLLERVGEGGMGQVFKARNWKLGRIVAIKVIRKEKLANPAMVRRFHREVLAASQLVHPNIVAAYDADEVGGVHFLAMEYVEGTDLSQVVKRDGPLPVAAACDYVRQAAVGLQHAYQHGLVHRDIKPHNLLLTPQGTVKVLDMGLARIEQAADDTDNASTLTREGVVMGTPDYIAPEQALDSRTADVRADLYSLGCTLYQLLAGRVPFPGGTLIQKVNRHQFDEPEPLEQVRADVPPAVAAVVRKLMAKRPQDRFQTPAELAAALATAAAAVPSGAATPAPPAVLAQPPASTPAAGAVGDTDTSWSSLPSGHSAPTAVPPRSRRPAADGRNWLWINLGGLVVIVLGAALIIYLLQRKPTAAQSPPPAEDQPAEPTAHPTLTNSIGMRLVHIPAGTFLMGSPTTEPGHNKDEGPPHRVTITKPFWMGAYEVTQRQYERVMGSNPAAFNKPNGGGPDHPVEQVSWEDANEFCWRLTYLDAERRAGRAYRLPTEAEWEYACRAGARTAYPSGDQPARLDEFAWHAENADRHTHPVGQLRRNAWGLYDMVGNVWEWCADTYQATYYTSLPQADPRGPSGGGNRVVRGYGWAAPAATCRMAGRTSVSPGTRSSEGGFRVVCLQGPALDALLPDDQWQRRVAALPPADRGESVIERLRQLNPLFDGTIKRTVEGDAVVGLEFLTDEVGDIRPLRALTGLKTLICTGAGAQTGRLTDLAALQGLRLTTLNCSGNRLIDLAPLRGMPLTRLHVNQTGVADLGPLEEMSGLESFGCAQTQVASLGPLRGKPLTELTVAGSRVEDLTPLRGMPLRTLACNDTPVHDLGPLAGAPLQDLNANGTRVADLAPLSGRPLRSLYIYGTPVRDLRPLRDTPLEVLDCRVRGAIRLTPLAGLPLQRLACNLDPLRDGRALRSLTKLQTVNDRPAADVLKEVAAYEAWARRAAGPPSPLDRLGPPAGPLDQAEAALPGLVGVCRGREGRPVPVALAPDGGLLAVGDGAGMVNLWDLTGREPRKRLFFQAGGGNVMGLAFGADGKLATACGGEVRLWAVAGAVRELATLSGCSPVWDPLAFAPDGKRLAFLSGATVRVYDVAGASLRERAVLTAPAQLQALAFAADGKRLAAGGADGAPLVWDLSGPSPRPTSLIGVPGHAITALAFGRDGTTLATAGPDAVVRLYDLAGAPEPVALPPAGGAEPGGLAYTRDGRCLFTAGLDGWLFLWDADGRTAVWRWAISQEIHRLALAADGRHLAVATRQGAVYLLRLAPAHGG